MKEGKKIFFHENSKYNYYAAINDTNTIVTNFTDIANFLNNYFREVADYVMVNQILQWIIFSVNSQKSEKQMRFYIKALTTISRHNWNNLDLFN